MAKNSRLSSLVALASLTGVLVFTNVGTVVAAANVRPVASFTYTRQVGSPNKVLLNGSSSTDTDGTIASWKWYRSGVQVATGVTPVVAMSSTGTTDVTLVVTDNKGATGTVTQTVLTPNRIPVVTSSSPSDGAVTEDVTPTLTVTAKDYDGEALTYYFTLKVAGAEDVLLESNIYFNGSWTVPTDLAPGDYSWNVRVMDSRGGYVDHTSALTIAAPVVAPEEPAVQ